MYVLIIMVRIDRSSFICMSILTPASPFLHMAFCKTSAFRLSLFGKLFPTNNFISVSFLLVRFRKHQLKRFSVRMGGRKCTSSQLKQGKLKQEPDLG